MVSYKINSYTLNKLTYQYVVSNSYFFRNIYIRENNFSTADILSWENDWSICAITVKETRAILSFETVINEITNN